MSKGVYIIMGGMAALLVGAMATTGHKPREAEAADPATAKCRAQYGAYDAWPGKTALSLDTICRSIELLAADETAKYQNIFVRGTMVCIDDKGFGQWTGSTGIPLEAFCARTGSMLTLNQLKIDHPEIF